jgi:hypothetical protein
VRNRKYGYCERKEVDVCPSDLEEGLLNPRKGGDRIFIDKRLWSSAEFVIAATAQLAHYSVHRDKDCRQATRQRSLLSPSDRAVASPCLVCLSLRTLWVHHRRPTFHTMPATPDLSRELTANPPSTYNHDWKRRAVGHV